MFIGIDGTGPRSNNAYEIEFQDSFVNKLYRNCSLRDAYSVYRRGPTLWGFESTSISSEVVNFVKKVVQNYGDNRICMGGYSRGGAICIDVAQRLQRDTSLDVEIECMVLFDAVDRAPGIDASYIPENVQYAYHAMRDPKLGSRSYFGNCGTTINSPGKLEMRYFLATHAALGGMPGTGDSTRTVPKYKRHGRIEFIEKEIISEGDDKDGSRRVREWVQSKIQRHGLYI